jgi:hypothetical protein
MLLSRDGRPFATGSISYWYGPTADDLTARIILQVHFEGVPAQAVIDTGALYVICAPEVSNQLSLPLDDALDRIVLTVQGVRLHGRLHRLAMTFPAETGLPLEIEVTAFVLDPDWHSGWGELPSFIGLGGCLERICFAIDPGDDTFYYGPLG